MTEWDVKKLRILRTLRDRGTVTATADALLMTPSAVSQQLSNLAKQLGVPLLEAQGRRVRLTDAAHLVLRHAEAVFAQLERADAELTGYLRGEAGEVRVAAFATAVPALVVPAVQRLRADPRPGPEIRVCEAEAAQAYELLAAAEVDLALSLAADAPTARDPGSPSCRCSPTRSTWRSRPATASRTRPGCASPTCPPSPGSTAARAPGRRSPSPRAGRRASYPSRRTARPAGPRSSPWSPPAWGSPWSRAWPRWNGTAGRVW